MAAASPADVAAAAPAAAAPVAQAKAKAQAQSVDHRRQEKLKAMALAVHAKAGCLAGVVADRAVAVSIAPSPHPFAEASSVSHVSRSPTLRIPGEKTREDTREGGCPCCESNHCACSFQSQSHIAWPQSNGSVEDIGEGLDVVASTMLPTSIARFRVVAYRDRATKAEPLAFVYGDIQNQELVPVRVHDQCQTSEVFGSLRCDCREQLHSALEHVRDHGYGAVVYLPQEGRGIGLANKIAAYSLQETGLDTVDANKELGLPVDARKYGCVGPILRHLKVKKVALLTNNPRKLAALERAGVCVSKRIPCVAPTKSMHQDAKRYIQTKIERMGHML